MQWLACVEWELLVWQNLLWMDCATLQRCFGDWYWTRHRFSSGNIYQFSFFPFSCLLLVKYYLVLLNLLFSLLLFLSFLFYFFCNSSMPSHSIISIYLVLFFFFCSHLCWIKLCPREGKIGSILLHPFTVWYYCISPSDAILTCFDIFLYLWNSQYIGWNNWVLHLELLIRSGDRWYYRAWESSTTEGLQSLSISFYIQTHSYTSNIGIGIFPMSCANIM